MSEKIPVSVLVMTKNEELNIAECLESVRWADEIIIIDSNSTDRTLEIARGYTDKIYRYTWDGKWPKKSWSLEIPKFSNDWILMIDADEKTTPRFKDELKSIVTDKYSKFAGYIVRYRYWFLDRFIKFGDPVRKLVLFRKSKSHFERHDIYGIGAMEDLEVGHEHPIIDGETGYTKSFLLHRDKRPLHYYFDRHNRYSTWESFLISAKQETMKNPLNTRRFLKNIFLRLPLKPLIYFIYSYALRLGFLDGYAGFSYNICKAFYAFQIGLKVHELKINPKKNK